MVTTKKFGRVTAMLLALLMLLTLVPFQSFAADVPAATDLVLKDGVTVAISSDMTEDQVKQALFNALVSNPEGANYQDYEWEYECEGKWAASWDHKTWGSVNGFTSSQKVWGVTYTYEHPAIKDNENGSWPVRLAGTETAVSINKVSSCTVNYNYDAAQGAVYVNDAQVSGQQTGVSPAADLQFTVVPGDGYKVASVTVNGEEIEAVDGVYTVLPVATTDINVTFEEEGTFYNVTVSAGEGVTVKMNGLEVSGNVKVAEGAEYTFEYTPNDSTSVKAVKVGDADVTGDVAFANYVGTQTLTFTGDTTLAVETVAKSAELVLTDVREAGVVINADGTWNYDGIRANLIEALIDKAQSIGVDFSAANVTIEQYTKYYSAGGVEGVSSDWVPLEGKNVGAGIYYNPVKVGSNHLRIAFNGNDQYRPTDYIELDVNLVDVQKSVIAIKENPVVSISETSNGVFDYTNLEQKVFDAAIDAANSFPANITLEDIELTVPTVTAAGDYEVTAKYPGSTSYYASEVKFNVHFDIVPLPAADIVLKSDTVDAVLRETTIGVYDNAALKEAVYAAAVDLDACAAAGLDVSKLVFEFADVTAEGQYTATVSYPETETMHGASKTVTVNVTIDKLPTAQIVFSADRMAAGVEEIGIGVYDIDSLKLAVFNALDSDLTTPELSFEDVEITFDREVNDDGEYVATVTYPGTSQMYGASASISIDVVIDRLPAVELTAAEGATVTLYKNYDRSYNYEGLKDQIFENVLTVANVDGLTRENFTFKYKLVAGSTSFVGQDKFYEFNQGQLETDWVNSGIYLQEGGNFEIEVSLPNGDDYYGATIYFNVNVEIGDTYVSEIVVNEGTHDVVLNKTKDGGYDYEALKAAVFAAAVSEVKNVPDTFELKWDAFDYEYEIFAKIGSSSDFYAFDEQTGPLGGGQKYLRDGGEFTVRIFLDDGDGFYGSFADVKINVTVVDPFASNLALNSEIAPVTLKETSVGVYDYDALKADIFAAAVDAANSTPANVSLDACEVVLPEINGSGSYNVTVKFLGSFDYNASSVSFDIQINVQDLPTANVALKAAEVNAVLKETEVGKYDLEALKQFVFEQAVDSAASTPAGLSYADVTFAFDRDVNADGEYTATMTYLGTSQMHGSSAQVKVNVTVESLPAVVIETQTRNLVLNKTLDGDYDYDGLKEAIFNECVRVSGVEGLTWNNFKFEYKLFNQLGTTDSWSGQYRDFEIRNPSFDVEETYKYLYKGGTFQIRVSIPDSSSYYGAEAELTVNVTIGDPYDAEIALKNNYQKDYVLNYAANGGFDYDALEKEIFDAVIDVENSTASVSFENATITYQILDAMGSPVGIGAGSYYDFAQGTLPADSGNTYKYMYKGGTFNIKVAVPATETHRAVEVTFDVNIAPAERVPSSVVLKSGTIDYTSDVNAIKEYIYNNLIDFNASKLPADVTIDDFTFEYYALYYTAGGVAGIDRYWVPIEGKEDVLDVYYKQIGNGTNTIRVVFNGTDDYLGSTSNEADFTMSKASFSISLKQNYRYLDEKYPLDLVQPSVNDNFEHFYFVLGVSSDQATIYLESLSGVGETDISVLPSIMFQTVLGRSAIEVYTQGLSRDELIKLINSAELASYAQDNYNIDAAAINAMKDLVNSIPASVTNIKLKEGQPTTPGTYTMFAMATNENYNTAYLSCPFYVKYHTTGTKLQFVQDTDGLNSLNVGNFDYSAVVTKDGVPVQSNNVKYIYTGFRSNALFYASTKEGPRETGIYTQTAWTLGGTYAFPKTRTFVVSIF